MPRKYIHRAKRYKKYDEGLIRDALKEYDNSNISLADISAKYNITKSVLHRHNTRCMKKQGGQTVLTNDQEDYIVENLNYCSEWGYPLYTLDIRILVQGYLNQIGANIKKFNENLPGPDFVKGFLERNKNKISLRIRQNNKRSRASLSNKIIEEYFTELKRSLTGVPLSNILNYDETNLSDDPEAVTVIAKRRFKYPETVVNYSGVSTSIMMAASADGALLPCYVVYKGTNLSESCIDGPMACRYSCTTSGWFDSNTFEDWVHTIALPYLSGKRGKKILIGDILSSRLSLNLIKECKEKNIHFIFLPANSSHLMQPLDLALFKRIKEAWRDILFMWKISDGQSLSTIPMRTFPSLVENLLDLIEYQGSSNILAGYMETGISPLNKNKVLERLPGNIVRNDIVVVKPKKMQNCHANNKSFNIKKKNELMHINVCINFEKKSKESKFSVRDTGFNAKKENQSKNNPVDRKRLFETIYVKDTNNINTMAYSDDHESQIKKVRIDQHDSIDKTAAKYLKIEKKFLSHRIPQTKLESNPNNIMNKKINNHIGSNNEDVFKKVYSMNECKEIKKREMSKETYNTEKELICHDFSTSEEFDVNKMPLFFKALYLFLQEKSEVGPNTELIIESKTEQKDDKQNNRTDTVTLASVENFDTGEKIEINLKRNKLISVHNTVNHKSAKNNYNLKDEEIVIYLLDDDTI